MKIKEAIEELKNELRYCESLHFNTVLLHKQSAYTLLSALESSEEKVKNRESAINILMQDVEHEKQLTTEWHDKCLEAESRLAKLEDDISTCGLAISHGYRCPFGKKEALEK